MRITVCIQYKLDWLNKFNFYVPDIAYKVDSLVQMRITLNVNLLLLKK